MGSRLSRAAALALAATLCLALVPARALADEGMFLPDAIARLLGSRLAQRGLKIPVTDVYNPSGVSIKDAVVIVDGGTGEFLSPDGLLLTNHHVAFDALVSASDPSKDYATNGYVARSRAEELPAKDYTVTITQDLKDVTAEVLQGVTDTMQPAERATAIQTKIRSMESAGARPAEGVQVRVMPMNEGLSYYQFTYFILRDVRIVYAPPKAIGFYGGDPDNFEWPRHCGDFTFMRAYVGPDGKPADYSTNNVPFKPKKFLPVSMGGVREGDFTMVMGYPGSTRRYRESYSVAYNQDVVLPLNIDIFTRQIEALREAGKADPALRIKLQSTIFDFSNTLKDFEGSVVAMRRANIVEKKRADEAAFTTWVNADPARKARYGEVLPSLAKAYQELLTTSQRDMLVNQIENVSSLLSIASIAQQVAAEKEKPEADRNPLLGPNAVARMRGQIGPALAERNATVERMMLAYLLQKADELPAGQKIEAIEKRFGSLKGEARRRAEEDFARSVVDSKRFGTAEGLTGLFDLTAAQMREVKEPLLDFSGEIGTLSREARARTQAFNQNIGRWRPLLVRGMSEMRGVTPYPDANRTLRFTYGEV
ncbi:MAG TPA: S46 family peptidase, partial [Pyrinomonadaceae bacterium]